jgi:uncharacterized protein (TIGR03083 family)
MYPDAASRDTGSKNTDYLSHLARDSARFVEVLAQAPAKKPVPTCPAWDADDLLWHLGDVQWFWGTIVSRGLTCDAEVEALVRPERPGNRNDLVAHFNRASAELLRSLSDASPDRSAWTWSDEHTVGFIRRRQAHEALIHRLDAELTSGARTPMDADLSTDGVDEALGLLALRMRPPGGKPRSTADPTRTVRVHTTDTASSWLVALGRPLGGGQDSAAGSEPTLSVAALGNTTSDAGGPVAATVSGGAADLDCWLWHRPTMGQLEQTGDPLVLDGLDEIIASP